jgi:hypothetical protein
MLVRLLVRRHNISLTLSLEAIFGYLSANVVINHEHECCIPKRTHIAAS